MAVMDYGDGGCCLDGGMICETHPWLSWPHGDCGVPGCPPCAGVGIMQQRVRKLQVAVQMREMMLVDLYRWVVRDDTDTTQTGGTQGLD